MRRVPRSTALAPLALLLFAAASSGQESSLTNHALASDLVPGEPRFDPPAAAGLRLGTRRALPAPALAPRGGNGQGQLQRRLRPHLERAWDEGTIRAHRGRRSDHGQLLLHRLEGRRSQLGDVHPPENCCPMSAAGTTWPRTGPAPCSAAAPREARARYASASAIPRRSPPRPPSNPVSRRWPPSPTWTSRPTAPARCAFSTNVSATRSTSSTGGRVTRRRS